jgi:hypothetical protein
VYIPTNHTNPAIRPAATHFSNALMFAPHRMTVFFEDRSCLLLHDVDSPKSYGLLFAVMKIGMTIGFASPASTPELETRSREKMGVK